MVSQDTTSDPNSSILHHFLISSSNPITNQSHFETHNFNPYESVSRPNNTYPESLNTFPTIHSLGERISRSVNLVQVNESDMAHDNIHFMNQFRPPNNTNSLSLSLGSQRFVPELYYKQSCLVSGSEETCSSEGIRIHIGGESSIVGTNALALTEAASVSHSYSKYLKPAQLLLEEVANVSGDALEFSDLRRLFLSGSSGATSSELKAELLTLSCTSSANKHELQIKISELIALLEQVENKYWEYCNRMEEAISSFEVIAGEGAAKAYTALALEAMCRHFCSLREAILAQIKVSIKKLSSELPQIRKGLSELSLFDRGIRQNRTSLQQLGLMQQRQVWRPIRGLPETSVAILRAWLFEHFLHPYPNDSEKLMLSSQTGLTKNQVSNWFINARVRFWKPMIEEMYTEEFGDSSSPEDSDPLFSSS